MARRKTTALRPLLESEAVREAARKLIEVVQEEAAARALTPKAYDRALSELGRLRGRPLMLPALLSGHGRGARVRLADGSIKLDFIGGIGVYALGHADPDLLETAVVAAAQDMVFQGHLTPGPEYVGLSKALKRAAGPRFPHVWLSISGAIANENALKMIYQQHAPADRMLVFERSFHGRTSAMQELTDKPGFREGQPLRGNVLHVPFFDPAEPHSIDLSLAVLEGHLSRHPGQIAGMCFEIVQGEGGVHTAPREFFAELMERCRDAGVAVWVDEVQTFARTGEYFAFQTFELEEFVDVVTVGKILQGSAVLFTKAYNPSPGLVAGTYAGSSVGMAVATRILERLQDESYLGSEGRISVLGRRVERRFESLRKRMPRAVGPNSGIGAMQAFVPFDGAADVTAAVMRAAYEDGLIVLSAGANPSKLRMLPPVNVTDEELECAFTILEKALRQVGEERGLPC